MSHSSFDLFHTGLSLGETTLLFSSPMFISRNKFPFPSPIHILHAHENAPPPPQKKTNNNNKKQQQQQQQQQNKQKQNKQ